jgi:hypothetical protein
MLESNSVYLKMGSHPLFRYAVRRICWAGTVDQLRRYNLRAALFAVGLVVGLWLLHIYYQLALYSQIYPGYIANPNTVSSLVIPQSGYFIVWLMLATIGLNFIQDFASFIFSLNSIGGEVRAGRWELLRMTPIVEEHIVAAKHSLAQVRAWRVMAVVLCARIATVLLILLHVFLLPVVIGDGPDTFGGFRYDFFNSSLALISVGIFLTIYVIEPLWRMRAVTAVGIAISARVYTVAFALLTAFAAMVVTWISQVAILGMIGWLTVGFFGGFFTLFMCGILVSCIATAYVVRAYYRGLEGWALGYAARRIHHEASRW